METEVVYRAIQELASQFADHAMHGEGIAVQAGLVVVAVRGENGSARCFVMTTNASGTTLTPWESLGLLEFAKDWELRADDDDEEGDA